MDCSRRWQQNTIVARPFIDGLNQNASPHCTRPPRSMMFRSLRPNMFRISQCNYSRNSSASTSFRPTIGNGSQPRLCLVMLVRSSIEPDAIVMPITSSPIGDFWLQRRTTPRDCRHCALSWKDPAPPGDRAIRAIPLAQRNLIPQAVAFLRMARALDQGRRGAIKKLKTKLKEWKRTIHVRDQARRRRTRTLESLEGSSLLPRSFRSRLGPSAFLNRVRRFWCQAPLQRRRIPVERNLRNGTFLQLHCRWPAPPLINRLRNSLSVGLCPTTMIPFLFAWLCSNC